MNITDHPASGVVKMLLIGESGTGKTCSLASLADAGYNVRILDLDNGIDALKHLLVDPKSKYSREAAARVDVQTITEKMRNVQGRWVPAAATVWDRVGRILTEWRINDVQTLGNIGTWTPGDVLVVDSLTYLSLAALNFHQAINGRLGQIPEGFIGMKDIGSAQALVERLLQALYAEQIRCNVIVISHITYAEDKSAPQTLDQSGTPQPRPTHGYPSSIGAALSPRVGRYFNSVLMTELVGSKLTLTTKTKGIVALKNTAPLRVSTSYPVETGLAQYFAAVKGDLDGKSTSQTSASAA